MCEDNCVPTIVYVDLTKEEKDICFRYTQFYLYANGIGFNKEETTYNYYIFKALTYSCYILEDDIERLEKVITDMNNDDLVEDKKQVKVLQGILNKIHKEVGKDD